MTMIVSAADAEWSEKVAREIKEDPTGVTYRKERKVRTLPPHVFAATTKSGVVEFGPIK